MIVIWDVGIDDGIIYDGDGTLMAVGMLVVVKVLSEETDTVFDDYTKISS